MDNQSGEEIEVRDFAYNNDVRPVSDPNIFSETQRLAQNQALLQMATSAPPGMFNLQAVYNRVLKQLKISSPDEVLPNPQGAAEANPALENVAMTMGKPSAAYPDQDHLAHIKIHLDYANNPAYGGSPVIGPVFSRLALDHIKQHLTLHYLQSMRAYVAQAAGGKDVFNLHEEKPLDLEGQQALAVAADLVNQDSQQMQAYVQQIGALAQKVQQMQQMQQMQAANADPTAQVILKTQMAETQRKAQEAQAKMQLEMGQDKQNYELQVAKLQQQMAELQAKYQTQTKIDAQQNATQIALADINNSSRERVAAMGANIEMTKNQLRMQHEQDLTAFKASQEANKDIRQHGLEVEQQVFAQQAAIAQQAAEQAASAEEQSRQRQFDFIQQHLDQQAQAEQQAQQSAPLAPQEPQQPQT